MNIALVAWYVKKFISAYTHWEYVLKFSLIHGVSSLSGLKMHQNIRWTVG